MWEWASNDVGFEPDVVLACAGDIATMETLAAAWWLRKNSPELKVRVVNVVDLMTLFPRSVHPHGMSETQFVNVFTADKPIVFAFHGYQRAIHQLVHGRPNADRFHVRGFIEQGTTTTPFDMVVLNEMSRYHLAVSALKYAPRVPCLQPLSWTNATRSYSGRCSTRGSTSRTCRRSVTGSGPNLDGKLNSRTPR